MKFLLTLSLLFISLISHSQMAGTLTEIYFEFDSYELTLNAKQSLDDEIMLFNETSEINLSGYTDTIGGVNYNLYLSQKRCEAVAGYLISKGIKASAIHSVGKGEREEYLLSVKKRAVSISGSTFHSLEKLIKKTPKKKEIEVIEEVKELEEEIQSLSDDVADLEVGQTVAIKGLSFIPGRHILLRSSEPKLYELLELLQGHPSLKVEIQGHICCSRDGLDGYDVDTDSKLLSLNRAINIYEYLVNQGISRDRLSYKGFGPNKPLVKEVDELTRQMNRRVEIKIVEK